MNHPNQIIKVTTISTLYIVPTPIGNLGDITLRALRTLKQVDLIAAEDTRRTGLLLQHFSIKTRMIILHNYNEHKATDKVITQLRNGLSVALVSDSGTPLINDPGYHLIKRCHQTGIQVIPLPGPCAAITALSASGITSDHFCYEGFLPAQDKSRRDVLKELINESRTLIFYESPHRLLDTLVDMIDIFGAERYVVLARELTKVWESIRGFPIGKLLYWLKCDKNRYRGEIVLVLEGYIAPEDDNKVFSPVVIKTLELLQQSLCLKKASSITAEIHGLKKNALYKYALKQKLKTYSLS